MPAFTPIESPLSVRLDKWLWAVRIYKTRSLAAAACDAGKVHVSGQRVKPSRAVKIGDLITAGTGEIVKTVKVLGLINRRVGARIASQYVEDQTPASEYAKAKAAPAVIGPPKGFGRPTKKDRRALRPFLPKAW